MNYTIENIQEDIKNNLTRRFASTPEEASPRQMYMAVCQVVQRVLADHHSDNKEKNEKNGKKVYYLSIEFLIGRSLRNHLYNLGLLEVFHDALKGMNVNLDDLFEQEPDAGLGNGGLGRLASCYMDSMSTLGLDAQGYSIRYELGIFRQHITDGWQTELPDDWLQNGDVWLVPRFDESVDVNFSGTVSEQWDGKRMTVTYNDCHTVMAIPHDMFVSGFGGKTVNFIRLWSAKSKASLDMSLFSSGQHLRAMEESAMAETLSKVLYPADDNFEGKSLRLKQQYFMVSASAQDIVKRHLDKYRTIDNFHEKVAIHINDTHPAIIIPELMRIFLDECDYSWESAWDIVSKTVAYTNHTVLQEALECWPEEMFKSILPRIYSIISEINERFCVMLKMKYDLNNDVIAQMAVISYNYIRMANLCMTACESVNGVSKLHSEILKQTVFSNCYKIWPYRFKNVTNGISYRRWLFQSNPLLTRLLVDTIGNDIFKDAMALEKFAEFKTDKNILSELEKIKFNNKRRLADYIKNNCFDKNHKGIVIDPNSLFDVQVKRLHEYKRQLLNAMHILYLYDQIVQNPNKDFVPRTFLFAAKASPGYYMAKQIIRFIVSLSEIINKDPRARDLIKVVFIEDYRVTLAELIMPAADISEQISLAGKEASGTGNMKLMINGAVTLGTMDGANIEILEAVGPENIFIFGMTSEEVEQLWQQGYNTSLFYQASENLQRVFSLINSGIDDRNFHDITTSLLVGGYTTADPYMCMADFESYLTAQEHVSDAYLDKNKWYGMSLMNTAKAGIFSADRSISEYAQNIWHVKVK